MLVGGVLLWRHRPLGYVADAGLLFQYGLTPAGLVVSMALRAVLTGSSLDVATSVVLLVFGMVCFAPLAFFVRGAARRRDAGQHETP
jgi:sulfite exporter TauE/SafE